MEPNYSVIWSARLVGAIACAVGDVLIPSADVAGRYVVATAANRGARGAEGIALTAWSSALGVGSVDMQQSGVVDASVSGLGTAASVQLVRTSAAGQMERVEVFTAGDDIIGYAELDGRVHLHFGLPWSLLAALVGGTVPNVLYKSAPNTLADIGGWTREADGRVNVTADGCITYGDPAADLFPGDGLIRVAEQSESVTDVIRGRIGADDWPILSVSDANATLGSSLRGSTTLRSGPSENIGITSGGGIQIDSATGEAINVTAGDSVYLAADATTGVVEADAASCFFYAYLADGGAIQFVGANKVAAYALVDFNTGIGGLCFTSARVTVDEKPAFFVGTDENVAVDTQMFGVQAGASGYVSLLASEIGAWKAGLHVITDGGLATGVTGAGVVATRNLALTTQAAIGAWAADPWGGAEGVMYFANAASPPGGTPFGGGYLYAQGGAGKGKGSSGTVTTLWTADPHCKTCGRDFSVRFENDQFDEELTVCVACLLDALSKLGVPVDAFSSRRLAA